MQELIKKIEQWAEDRNIINGSKPIDQAVITLHLAYSDLKENIENNKDCKNGIGVIFSLLVIMCKQNKQDIRMAIDELNYLTPFGELSVYNLKNSVDLISKKFSILDVADILLYLTAIAKSKKTTLKKCVQTTCKNLNGAEPTYNETLQKLGKA